jgi:hypothetical protein
MPAMNIRMGLSRRGTSTPPTAATLSGLAYAADLISVTTDTASGTIYYLLHNSVTPLSGSAIKSAVIGLTAVGGGTLDPLETANQPVDWTLITPGTYWINMVQESAGGFSNVVFLEVTIIAAVYDPAADAELVWDVAEISTLFQDTAAATPVTTTGQSVGRMNNRGTLGGDFRNTGATDRPVYTESGALRYLQFDGSNDFIRWLGTNGDIDLTGGFYLVFGMSETTTISDRSFLSAASTTGDAINNNSGFVMYSSDNTTNATAYIGGLLNSNGHEIVDTGGGQLPLTVNEVEVTPATGSANATLRVRRVGDGDVVDKGTDTANSGQFPNVATAVAQLCLGSGISGGSPATFTNIRIYCGILKFGAVTSGMRADMRAWVAGKIGF